MLALCSGAGDAGTDGRTSAGTDDDACADADNAQSLRRSLPATMYGSLPAGSDGSVPADARSCHDLATDDRRPWSLGASLGAAADYDNGSADTVHERGPDDAGTSDGFRLRR